MTKYNHFYLIVGHPVSLSSSRGSARLLLSHSPLPSLFLTRIISFSVKLITGSFYALRLWIIIIIIIVIIIITITIIIIIIIILLLLLFVIN